MNVSMDALVWIPLSAVSQQQVDRIRRALTVYPRGYGNEDTPDPIPLYRLRGSIDTGDIGVPRAWFFENRSEVHRILDMTELGDETNLSSLSTTWQPVGPYAFQDEAVYRVVDAIQRPPFGGILAAGCGTGKALAHGEPVLTSRGEIPIEKISVGDMVVGTDGAYHRVVGVFPQGEREIYRVTFSDGSHVDCDADHLWTVERRRTHTKSVVTLTTRHISCLPLKNKSGWQFFLPTNDPVPGRKPNSLLDPYALGALIGDGNLTRSDVNFTTADPEMLSLVRLPPGHRWTPSRREEITWRISMNRSNAGLFRMFTIRQILDDLGLRCGSHGKFVPDSYKYADPDTRLSVLQGLFDTDGSPSSGRSVEYSTVSERLAEDVRWMVSSLGGVSSVNMRKTRYTCADGSKSRWFQSFRLLIRLPSRYAPFRLARKAVIHESGVRQHEPARTIRSVERIGSGLATCISVDSPDHLFLTRNCVPTHNTTMAIEAARRLGRPTMILVHKEFLVRQWVKRIRSQIPYADVGVVQQKKCDFEGKHFVVGLLQSLAARDYGEEFYSHFGTVISDETHRVAARTWYPVLSKFPARFRIGVTATARRKDGTEDAIFLGIGPICYTVDQQMMPFRVRSVRTKFIKSPQIPEARVKNMMARDIPRNATIVDELRSAVLAGRKVMVMSERIEMLHAIGNGIVDRVPDVTVGVYCGEWPNEDGKKRKQKEADLAHAEKCQVILCTRQMVEEALDIWDLDTLFLTTPIGDVEQAVGRIRRYPPLGSTLTKRAPLVVDFVDDVSFAVDRRRARERWYTDNAVDFKG